MDQDPPKVHCKHYEKYFPQQKKPGNCLERTMPKFSNIVYKCLFTFKGGYAVEICIGMGLGL